MSSELEADILHNLDYTVLFLMKTIRNAFPDISVVNVSSANRFYVFICNVF